ncbi:MAG: hypothetical protein U0900_15000 [Myxococcota bacterium]
MTRRTYVPRPSTLELSALAGVPPEKPIADADAEVYRVYESVIALGNRLYGAMGDEAFRCEQWPMTAEVEAALRAALVDNVGNYGGQGIAHYLARAGCDRPETIRALHPWHAVFYAWREAGHTPERVLEMVLDSRVVSRVPDGAATRIAGWLANPFPIPGIESDLPFALFGPERIAVGFLVDDGFEPRHDELLSALATTAMPTLPIEDARQFLDRGERFVESTEASASTIRARDGSSIAIEGIPVLSDDGAHWVVEYALAGARRAFFARASGTWMDWQSVRHHFDALMIELARPERVFRFEVGLGEPGEHGFFIVAEPERLEALAKQLFIPLAD